MRKAMNSPLCNSSSPENVEQIVSDTMKKSLIKCCTIAGRSINDSINCLVYKKMLQFNSVALRKARNAEPTLPDTDSNKVGLKNCTLEIQERPSFDINDTTIHKVRLYGSMLTVRTDTPTHLVVKKKRGR